ncbi:MAG: non-canonical purine NTP pyrophosphatase [bacterium]|nr:non-canonical purine NTP pyrophosphatase [bacterium]
MKKILLATTNPGKKMEMLSALIPFEGIEFLDLNDLGIDIEVHESGMSYSENALIKAKAYFEHSKIPTIAEDSGVEIQALADELGIHTRRWGAGERANDEEWLEFFMNRMQSEENRLARFVSHAIYLDEQGHHCFEGECLGEITRDIEGPIQPGIPLSAVFKPIGHDRVYSAMEDEEKNAVSHRGWAIRGLREYLLALGG